MENGVDPSSIEDISNEELKRGLMANASTIISREMRPKLLCLKVDEEVVVPRVIRRYVEEVFVRGILSIRGKIHNEFGEEKHFLAFGSIEL
jgi:hypothetical protein